MDLAIWVLGLGMASLIVLSIRNGRKGDTRDLSDVMSGLFGGPHDPSWPRGVQEEDTIRPWSLPVSTKPDSAGDPGPRPPEANTNARTGPSTTRSIDDPVEASLEDGVEPVHVARVQRAA